jgi:SAM-dependent methyltransferase
MAPNKWTPGALLEMSGGYWAACTLHTAVHMDLFTAVGDECLTASQIASAVDADPRATRMLLNALCAMGLMVKAADGYHNSEAAIAHLCRGGAAFLGDIIAHHRHLVPSWARLDEAVVSGAPLRSRAADDDGRRASFLMGMANLAARTAPVLVPTVDLGDRSRLLDLGGGPGTYAIHFCRHYPQLTAMVFDLPTTRPFAAKTIAEAGLQERIAFIAGDYLKDPLPTGCDVIWLSHILHAESPGDCRRLLERTAEVLPSGGRVLIHDFILDEPLTGPVFPALFSLNMLLGTQAGQSYSEGQLRDMLAAARFRQIRRIPVATPNDSGVLTAVR